MAIHVLLIHSIFVVAFILFLFFFTLRTEYVFCNRYNIDIISSNAYTCRNVVRMAQVFDLEKCSISKRLLQVFKRENNFMLCNNGFLIH